MKKIQTLTLFLFAIAAFSLNSCKDEIVEPTPTPTDPFENLVYIGETEAVGAGAIVKLYAEDELFMGYNRIHIAIYDSANHNTQLTDAHVTFNPMMDMGMMQHSCPFEDPGMEVEDGTKTFKGAVVFIMPTTSTGSWNLGVNIHNHANGQEGLASFDITVIENAEPRLFSFISEIDSAKIFVALIEPTNPEIGLNDFVLGVYEKESMMSFPSVEGMVIISEPWMPSMNHGSPNNVDPVSVGAGKYEGVLNFTMSGYWQIKLEFENANQELIKGEQYFDVTFQ